MMRFENVVFFDPPRNLNPPASMRTAFSRWGFFALGRSSDTGSLCERSYDHQAVHRPILAFVVVIAVHAHIIGFRA